MVVVMLMIYKLVLGQQLEQLTLPQLMILSMKEMKLPLLLLVVFRVEAQQKVVLKQKQLLLRIMNQRLLLLYI